jgi:hypothetical protein
LQDPTESLICVKQPQFFVIAVHFNPLPLLFKLQLPGASNQFLSMNFSLKAFSAKQAMLNGPLVTAAQVVDGGEGLQVWRVAVNILIKQSLTADKG